MFDISRPVPHIGKDILGPTKRRPEAQGSLFLDLGHNKLPLISQVHHGAGNVVKHREKRNTDWKGVKYMFKSIKAETFMSEIVKVQL